MSGTFDGTKKRTYEETHPWISFKLDLTSISYRVWMDLGAIQSKIEHVANTLLPPRIANELRTLYLAKGVHATTAIEGNSMTEDQVRDRIVNKTPLPASKAYLGTEVDNITKACNETWREVMAEQKIALTPDKIQAFNKTVLDALPVSEHVVPGEIRTCSVGVGNYKAPPWEDCRYLLTRLCKFLDDFTPAAKEMPIGFAVLKAIIAHLYIAWIHPFGDGNGRTARLVEFQILLSGGVPDIAAHLLSNFYNQTRDKYYRELERASHSAGDVTGFLRYAIQGMRDALDDQIKHIRQFQWTVVWRDVVYGAFRHQSGEAAHRRRMVALELAAECEGVSLPKLRRLTPEIAEMYAGRTNKTITRDINELEKMNLICKRDKLVQVNSGMLSQFLPGRKL
jgi:Fic family protein